MKCEKMRQSLQPDTVKAHYTCDVHKLYTATSYSMDHCSDDVSGLLSLGLSHHGSAGAYQQILRTLDQIVQDELVVSYGSPDPAHVQYREQLFNVFLPVYRGHRCKKTNAKRRYILHQLLNGDWQSDQLEHVCSYGCCLDFADTLRKVKQFLIWAMAPTKCRKYCRSRWTNYDIAIDWAGLLGNICQGRILAKLVSKMSGTTAPATAPTMQMAPLSDTGANKWLELADEEIGVTAVAVRHEEGEEPLNPDQSQNQKDPSMVDWAKVNESHRKSATEWASSIPGIRLIIMKVVAAPLLTAMLKFLRLSSPKWEKEQAAKVALGQRRSYRVLEGALGTDLAECMDTLLESTRGMLQSLPSSGKRRCVRTLHFRMVATALASLHAYLRVEREGLRFQWFRVLLQDEDETDRVYQIPHCMADELSAALLEQFPKPEDAGSLECQSLAAFLACALYTDIAKVEARHSSNREVTFARARGWEVDMSDLNAKFVCRQFASKKPKKKGRGKPGPRPKHTKKRNTKGGGAWRAFIHVKHKGKKWDKDSMKLISREYRSLSPEEKAYYKEIGAAATQAHRHGFASFGQTRKPTSGVDTGNQRTSEFLEPGHITSTGAVVAGDIIEPDLILTEYTGQVFEEAYEELKKKLLDEDRSNRASDDLAEKLNEQALSVYSSKSQLPDPETLPRFETSTSIVPSAVVGQQRVVWQPNIQGVVEANFFNLSLA